MYEDDTPPAERRAQALSLDRDLLRELLGQEELRDLLDADAVADVERQLGGAPRTPDELHDQLRVRGDRRPGEYDPVLAEPLLTARRAALVRFAGEERLIAAEDAGRYRDALGVMPPSGLPDVYLEGGPDSLRQLVVRFGKGRGPFTTAEANERFGRDVSAVLAELEREELLLRGELRPGGSEREWCDPDVLRRLRRASLAALRREVEPVEREALARFLPPGTGSTGVRPSAKRSSRSRASRSPCRCGRARCFPGGCPGTAPSSSMRSVQAAKWCGSAPGSTASRSTSVRTPLSSARLPPPRRRSSRRTTGCARHWPGGRCSGSTCSKPAGCPTTRPCRRSGTLSGRER